MMALKSKLLAAALGVAGITIIVAQHLAMQRLRAEAEELRSQAAEVESLRTETARLAKIEVEAKELPRLRAQESELLKLRGEVPLLRQAVSLNSNLQQRLAAAQTYALNARAAAEDEARQLAAASAALAARGAATASTHFTCIANLKNLYGAKVSWALEHRKKAGDLVAMTDLVPLYLKIEPKCPAGNTSYLLNATGVNPTCPNYNSADPELSLHMLDATK